MNRERHRPQPAPKAVARDHEPADDAADGKHDHADRAVDKANCAVVSAKPPASRGSSRNGVVSFTSCASGKRYSKQKCQDRQDPWLAEESTNGTRKPASPLPPSRNFESRLTSAAGAATR